MKLSVSVIIALFYIQCNISRECQAEEVKERPCNLAFKCSLQEDTSWSTDGTKCYVHRNPCHLANENCQRQNCYKNVLEVVSKEECQALCKPRCPRIMKPVCGYYNDLKRQFSNQCLMDYHICNTGETYMLYNEGRCEEPLNLAAT